MKAIETAIYIYIYFGKPITLHQSEVYGYLTSQKMILKWRKWQTWPERVKSDRWELWLTFQGYSGVRWGVGQGEDHMGGETEESQSSQVQLKPSRDRAMALGLRFWKHARLTSDWAVTSWAGHLGPRLLLRSPATRRLLLLMWPLLSGPYLPLQLPSHFSVLFTENFDIIVCVFSLHFFPTTFSYTHSSQFFISTIPPNCCFHNHKELNSITKS